MRPEVKSVKTELSENEKLIFEKIQQVQKAALLDIKSEVNLSNKAWDNSIKSLTKAGLLKVSKEDETLYIQLV
jgi:lysyl-tRNA synthetase class 2